jgi:hypothetical protein
MRLRFFTGYTKPSELNGLAKRVERAAASLTGRPDVVEAVDRIADAAGADALMISVDRKSSPVAHPRILELDAGVVAGLGDEQLAGLLADAIAERERNLEAVLEAYAGPQRAAESVAGSIADAMDGRETYDRPRAGGGDVIADIAGAL